MSTPPTLRGTPGDPVETTLLRDPFEAPAGPDPLEQRLDQVETRPRPSRARTRPAPVDRPAQAPRPTPVDPPPPTRVRRETPRRPAPPTLGEVELPEARNLLDRLLPDRARRALETLNHLVEGESLYDRFGFSPRTARQALPWFHLLYRHYFRVQSEGHENLPETGPVVLAANHAGLLPFDAAMTVMDVLQNTDPPRLPRAIVDRWAGQLPFVNVFYARVGQVIGTRENFADLLDDDQLVLVFPEGTNGIKKTVAHRYRVQHFRVGFVENALRAGAPIVPMAVVGSDDQAPILYDVEPLARILGLPVAPITPTFPLLGPLGLLPYPVGYRIVYGEPFDFHERFGPDGADDPRLVEYLAKQVRRSVQQLIDRNRA